MSEEWLQRLKAAYEAGYYQTEVDLDRQIGFPWLGKRCRDCPFWMNDRCQVDLRSCRSDEPPCGYYDPPDFPEARRLITERLRFLWRRRRPR